MSAIAILKLAAAQSQPAASTPPPPPNPVNAPKVAPNVNIQQRITSPLLGGVKSPVQAPNYGVHMPLERAVPTNGYLLQPGEQMQQQEAEAKEQALEEQTKANEAAAKELQESSKAIEVMSKNRVKGLATRIKKANLPGTKMDATLPENKHLEDLEKLMGPGLMTVYNNYIRPTLLAGSMSRIGKHGPQGDVSQAMWRPWIQRQSGFSTNRGWQDTLNDMGAGNLARQAGDFIGGGGLTKLLGSWQ